MNEKDIYEFFKQAYEFEHQRKDALNSRLILVSTSLVVIIGAVTYFINNMRFTPIDTLKVVFFILLAGLAIVLGFAFYYLFKCFFSYRYRYVAKSDLIKNYITELKEYNRKSPDKVDIGNEIEDYLKSQYSSAASINRANNIIKSSYFIRALRAIFIASILVFGLAVPFYGLKLKEPQELVRVNVNNFSEITKMSIAEQSRNPFENPTNSEPEPEPTLPTPPPPDDINEAEAEDSDIETKMDEDQ